MDSYCITAANHKNKNNHCASSFQLWRLNPIDQEYYLIGAKSLSFVSELLVQGHQVFSAKYNAKNDYITLGAPIEIELRIAKNETDYKITEMPTF